MYFGENANECAGSLDMVMELLCLRNSSCLTLNQPYPEVVYNIYLCSFLKSFSDIMDNYRSPFLETAPDSFLDLHSRGGDNQGNFPGFASFQKMQKHDTTAKT